MLTIVVGGIVVIVVAVVVEVVGVLVVVVEVPKDETTLKSLLFEHSKNICCIITLKFEQDGFTKELCILKMQPELQTV